MIDQGGFVISRFLYIFILAAAISAHAGDLVKSAILPSGIPLIYATTCSSAAVKSSKLGDKEFFFSARHCFSDGPDRYGIDYQGSGYDSMSVMGVFNPFNKAFDFRLNDAVMLNYRDIVAVGLEKPSEKVEVLNLAKKLPNIGSQVTVHGYPYKHIPLVGGFANYSTFRCTYEGPTIETVPGNRVKGEYSVFQMLLCDQAVFVQGASGGPVVDAENNYIGQLSMGMLGRVKIIDQGQEIKKMLLLFNEITEQTVVKNDQWGLDVPVLNRKYANQPFTLMVFTTEDDPYAGGSVFRTIDQLKPEELSAQATTEIVTLHRVKGSYQIMNDVMHGAAAWTYADGRKVNEIWENGKLKK